MIVFLIFMAIIVGFNFIPLLTKKRFLKFERIITKLLVIATLIFLVSLVLLFYNFKLKGLYSNFIVGAIFILISLIYLSVIKNTKRKILIVLILTPLIFLCSYTFLFIQTNYEKRLTDNLIISTSTRGFLSCGEHIIISKTEYGIFDKEIYHDGNHCLINIEQIEIKRFDKDSAIFLIYHDGKMDPENPYLYGIENKNLW